MPEQSYGVDKDEMVQTAAGMLGMVKDDAVIQVPRVIIQFHSSIPLSKRLLGRISQSSQSKQIGPPDKWLKRIPDIPVK